MVGDHMGIRGVVGFKTFFFVMAFKAGLGIRIVLYTFSWGYNTSAAVYSIMTPKKDSSAFW